jgi:acyl-CoA thioester hydrolase
MTMIHQTPIRVRYSETDQMGIAHHASYAAWFEVARIDFLEAVGSSYKSMEERGFLLAVIELSIRYKKPALFDERITVRSWLKSVKPVKVGFQYEVVNEAGDILTEGTTILGCLNREGRPQGLPPDVLELLMKAMAD